VEVILNRATKLHEHRVLKEYFVTLSYSYLMHERQHWRV